MTDELKYLQLLPQLLMDENVTEYNGFNPEKGAEETILRKQGGQLWIHAFVYALLEENELMDDLLDYFSQNRMFSRVIVFDDQNQSVIRLDY